MPTKSHQDYLDDEARQQARDRQRRTIFKVVEPFLWLIMIIIVVAVCLGVVWAMGYFSVQNPIDAIPTFVP